MIHWFKKHPRFLEEESQRLSQDLNYKERYQTRNNLFVSHGNIIVRLDKIYRFPILIVYTDATPYALPLIFPLNKELDNKRVIEISRLDISQVGHAIGKDVKLYFKFRHQNISGALCILEWDNLDTGMEFYSITTILKRIKEWCSGTITGNFPPDSQEVELFAHFNRTETSLKLLYPDNFLNEDVVEGICYASLYGFIPKEDKYTQDRRLFFGCLLNGKSKAGLYSNFEFNKALIHSGFDTPLELLTKTELANNLIEQQEMLKAPWFHIDEAPAPFENFSDLITIIGNGNYDHGVARIANTCFDEIKGAPENFMMAIRFPNHKGILEFQLFKLSKKPEKPGFIVIGDKLERIKSIAEVYDFVAAIECEKLTESNFHERNGTRANYDVLKNASVNFIGVGALGSDIADAIGKAGIGSISLIDNQVFKAHNAVRHLVGINQTGQLKVEATAHYLQQHNPFIDIRISHLDVMYHDINAYTEQNSLSVSTIADDNVEGFVNEQAVITNKPVFYVRALRGGKVGRIFRVIPGKDACLNCLSLYRDNQKDFITIPEDPDQPTIKNECNNPIRPASAADLKIISSLASRLIIDHLQNGPSEMNHWLWSTEEIASLPKYSVHSQHIPIHPQCIYCNHDQKLKIVMKNEVLAFMNELVQKNNTIETGGVLAGNVNEEEGTITIQFASGPGPKAICTAKAFEKDIAYCQEYLDNLYKQYGNKAVYVGEWHSHPSANNNPSGTDIRSLTEIAYQKEYVTNKPAMIILSDTGQPSCTVHPVGKTYYYAKIEPYL